MESFRKMPADLTPEEAQDKAQIYLFELNLLLRSLAMMGVTMYLDTVDREEGWSQVVMRGPEVGDDDAG